MQRSSVVNDLGPLFVCTKPSHGIYNIVSSGASVKVVSHSLPGPTCKGLVGFLESDSGVRLDVLLLSSARGCHGAHKAVPERGVHNALRCLYRVSRGVDLGGISLDALVTVCERPDLCDRPRGVLQELLDLGELVRGELVHLLAGAGHESHLVVGSTQAEARLRVHDDIREGTGQEALVALAVGDVGVRRLADSASRCRLCACLERADSSVDLPP